ncbi:MULTISPECIES: class I lanthipeptide [Flavobacterium]|uniref:Class I lanthipeptide n=1 Tax=Flavobacterium jumunjinense TaxID=998845 RepID=A0ABV5GRJ6_9FLAO|nr:MULTISPECIES: class I lanthipeptide [Flavobacterium]
MKKVQLNKGLNLNKETVTKLQESQLPNLKGGVNRVNAVATCANMSCTDTSCNESSCIG